VRSEYVGITNEIEITGLVMGFARLGFVF
jgi:hypothetical protein